MRHAFVAYENHQNILFHVAMYFVRHVFVHTVNSNEVTLINWNVVHCIQFVKSFQLRGRWISNPPLRE